MSKKQKFFMVEEANSLIPKLSALVERVRLLKEEISSQAPELEPVLDKAKINGGYKRGAIYVSKLTKFYNCINSITDKGCILKDIDLGLIDFPSIRNGREVYLCWKLGEDSVRFWHEIDTGFAGRKPL